MADQQQPKQINFTIVPDENPTVPRTYSNFCSIAHTPFDFTLTFCEVMPLSEKEIKEAESEHVVRAPVRTKIVVPVQFVPNLIAALQEHWRVYSGVLQQRRLEQGHRAGSSLRQSVGRPFRGASQGRLQPRSRTHDGRPVKTAGETLAILDLLETQHPDADTELHYKTPFELLVATILSAQSTDARVNMVTPALFKRYPDARALAQRDAGGARAADPLDRLLPRQVEVAHRHGAGARRAPRRQGAGRHGRARRAAGRRPQDGQRRARPRARRPGLPVDRHVLRVANRIGIAESDDPDRRRAAAVRPRCRPSAGRARRTR